MIDDIVLLPRPFARHKGPISVASYSAYEPPASPLGMALGISTEIKDMPICVGSEFNLITGSDAMYRYKLIEHDAENVREYMVVSDGPLSSNRCKMFTLWVDEIEKSTLLRARSYFWDLLDKARKYFSFHLCPSFSNEVYDKVKLIGALIGAPWVTNRYTWPHVITGWKSSDSSIFDDLQKINGNIDVMDTALANGDFVHELDMYRGVSEDSDNKIDLTTGLGRILSSHVITPKDLKRFIGPNYSTRINPEWAISNKSVDNSVKDAAQDANGWIDVFKYISDIPYSEVFAAFEDGGYKVVRVFDPYDRPRSIDFLDGKVPDNLKETLGRISDDLTTIGNCAEFKFYRSWSEEVYITIKTGSGANRMYYFDMAYLALSLPMFTDSDVVS